MATAESGRLSGGAKLVLGLTALGLVVMLAEATIFRLDHPSLVVFTARQADEHGASSAMAGSMVGGMGPAAPGGLPPGMAAAMPGGSQIAALMARMAENPNDPVVLADLAERFMAAGDWERVKLFADRALVAAPTQARALFLAAQARAELGDHAAAAQRFELLLELPGATDDLKARARAELEGRSP